MRAIKLFWPTAASSVWAPAPQVADVVLLDIWLPGIDGMETLEKLVESEDHPEVIMISGHGKIETAVRATKLGAFDFLEKPLSIERTLIVLKNAIEAKRLRSENLEFRKQFRRAA